MLSANVGDREELREIVIDALASVQARSRAEIEADILSSVGDLAIDSKEAECVIDEVEHLLGTGPTVSGDQLEPEQLSGLEALTDLLAREILRGET